MLRHSTAHLMAQAVKRLFPDTQVTIGPVIEDGFFYDFKKDTPFTPEDLERIEAEMRAIVEAATSRSSARRWTASEAIALLPRAWASTTRRRSSPACPSERVGLYRQGEFVDLCRGPHVPRTGAHQAPSSSPASPAPTGAATSATRCCSASTAPRSPARTRSRSTWRASKRRRSATTASSARSSTSSSFDAGRAGQPVLPPQGRRRLQRAGQLRARPLPPLRLRRGHHAAGDRRRAVEALRPLRQLPREHVLHRSSRSASSRSSR